MSNKMYLLSELALELKSIHVHYKVPKKRLMKIFNIFAEVTDEHSGQTSGTESGRVGNDPIDSTVDGD